MTLREQGSGLYHRHDCECEQCWPVVYVSPEPKLQPGDVDHLGRIIDIDGCPRAHCEIWVTKAQADAATVWGWQVVRRPDDGKGLVSIAR